MSQLILPNLITRIKFFSEYYRQNMINLKHSGESLSEYILNKLAEFLFELEK